ncbi:MAG: hypothetical protein AB7N76_00395 [Planctomycetota bacterium]
MPWDHCDVEFILDDEACPTCGQIKAAWTVEVEKTRTLVIGRKKKQRPEQPRLTLAQVARSLERHDREGGAATSRRFLRALDHGFLNDLARRGVADADPENDPSLLAPEEQRALAGHVLLWGMKAADYPRVGPTQRLLLGAFEELRDDAAYQDELARGWFGDASLAAYDRWLDQVAPAPGVGA